MFPTSDKFLILSNPCFLFQKKKVTIDYLLAKFLSMSPTPRWIVCFLAPILPSMVKFSCALFSSLFRNCGSCSLFASSSSLACSARCFFTRLVRCSSRQSAFAIISASLACFSASLICFEVGAAEGLSSFRLYSGLSCFRRVSGLLRLNLGGVEGLLRPLYRDFTGERDRLLSLLLSLERDLLRSLDGDLLLL